MLIRDAVVDDAEPIARLHVAAWRAAYRDLVPAELLDRLSVPARIEQAREILGRPQEGRTFVAETDGAVAGWCRVGPAREDDAPGDVELWALYLAPEAWGRGIGAAMLREAETEGAAYLWTLEGNARARRFYERHGWRCDGTVRERDFAGVFVDRTPLTLAEIRYRIGPLAAERGRTLARIASLRRDFDGIVAAADLSNADDEHDPEGATIGFERQQVAALLDQAYAQLARVERAAELVRTGEYGRCERCGAPIGDERLAARPTATTCIGCAT